MRRLWIAVAVLMFTAGKAEAEFYSGDRLLGICESDDVISVHQCRAYLAAIDDMHSTYDHWGFLNKEICLPERASDEQLRKVAIKGLNEKPEQLHHGAAGLVYLILRDAFPCD